MEMAAVREGLQEYNKKDAVAKVIFVQTLDAPKTAIFDMKIAVFY